MHGRLLEAQHRAIRPAPPHDLVVNRRRGQHLESMGDLGVLHHEIEITRRQRQRAINVAQSAGKSPSAIRAMNERDQRERMAGPGLE
jgi:hypothetical protein